MASNTAKMECRIAGLISTFQCISSLAEKTRNATPQTTTKMLATTRLSLLETNWERFQTEHIALLEMNCENLSEAPYFKDAVESRCQQAYEEAKVSLLTVKEHYEQVEPTGANLADVSAFPGTSNIRSALPKLRVPDFDGEFQSWRPFRDLFVSLVGQNQDITAVEKMHYLRLSVKGDAAKLIANLPLSSDSFVSAWDFLVARYEDKRLLVTSHLDRFFSMPTIVPRSYKPLNTLISTTSEILNALKSLEMSVDEWSVILAHFIVSRLDPNLREQWELKLGTLTTPATLPQLCEFLTTRARALESIDVRRSTSMFNRSTSSATSNSSRSARTAPSAKAIPARGSPPPYLKVQGGEWTADTAAAVAATVPLQAAGSATQCCHYCLGFHSISKCDLFKRKPSKERRVIAELRRLCFNCLGPHSAKNCRITGRCLECNGKHHMLIHLPSSSSTAPSTSRPSTSRASPQSQTPKSKPLATSSLSEAQG